ncbi:MAG: hypothetical protein P8X74_17470 [Reinekea sp.]|jgi:hypothetical protein
MACALRRYGVTDSGLLNLQVPYSGRVRGMKYWREMWMIRHPDTKHREWTEPFTSTSLYFRVNTLINDQ